MAGKPALGGQACLRQAGAKTARSKLLAVKIVRQANQITLIGAATSGGAHGAGCERAPAALRAAGLVARLEAAGYQVTDAGDIPVALYQPDDESPRARNVAAIIRALEALRPRVEQAYRAGTLPVVLGGDCTIVLGTLAGLRRYVHTLGLLYFDRDADLHTPATTVSGHCDGMAVSHVVGRGAPELVRFWSAPPLVREPDVMLFGLDRLDPPEQLLLKDSPIRHCDTSEIARRGLEASAEMALARLHASTREFLLHFDLDVIAAEDFPAADVPGAGGLRLEQVRRALEILAGAKHLAALEVSEYNPERDPDGQWAKVVVELIAGALAARLAALTAAAAAAEQPAEEKVPAEAVPAAETASEPPAAEPAPVEASAAQPEASQPEPQGAEPSPVEASPAQADPPQPDEPGADAPAESASPESSSS
jgi:arginase